MNAPITSLIGLDCLAGVGFEVTGALLRHLDLAGVAGLTTLSPSVRD